MKKLLILPLLFLSTFVFSQTIVNRASSSNTVNDWRHQAGYNEFLPRFNDTTAANLQIGIDSCGAEIYTRSPQAIWYRSCYPSKHWARVVDVNNFSEILNNNHDTAISNITIINDSTIQICNGANVCDTLSIVTNIVNISTIDLLNDSTIIVCGVDTTGGTPTNQCDTINIGRQNIVYLFENWLRQDVPAHSVEFGSNTSSYSPGLYLEHNTYASTNYFKMFWQGNTVYDYPNNFSQGQNFQVSTGIASFKSDGNSNKASLGINYFNHPYSASPYIAGYLAPYKGYSIGGNVTGNGSYGLRYDDSTSKTSGIFIHTNDTANNIAVTVYGVPIVSQAGSPYLAADLANYQIANFYTDLSTNFLGKVYLTNGRLEPDTAQIVAANNLTLGLGNVFLVSGNTQITAITTSGWQAGSSPVYLVFSGTPTVKNNTAGGAGTAPILLAGSIDFTASAGDILTLLYDGTQWRETARRLANSVGTGGYFAPDQTSFGTTTHDQNYHQFYVNNQAYTQYTAGTGANQSLVAWDSTQTFLQTNKANFRTIISTVRNLTSVGGNQFSTYNTSTAKGKAILSYPDSLVLANTSTNDVVIDYTKPLIKLTKDSLLIKNLPRSTDTLILTMGADSVVRTRGVSTLGYISGITADNGLTASTATNAQWGATAAGANSPLLHDTYINTGGFLTTFIGSNTGRIATFTNSGSGTGIIVTATNEAIRGASTNVFGVIGTSTNSIGAYGFSSTNTGVQAETATSTLTQAALVVKADVSSSSSSVQKVIEIQRLVSGGNGVSGIGGYVNWTIDDDAGQATAGQITMKWVDATHATNKAQYDIGVTSSNIVNTIASFYGSGVVGIGISSAYTATRLNVVDNSLAGASMVDLTSTSTAAASNSQKMVNISLSGANATASQTTYGLYISNAHSGTSPLNRGIDANVSNGSASSVAVRGQADNGFGMVAVGTGTATGISASASGAGNGGSFTSADGTAITGSITPSSTNTVTQILDLSRGSTGTADNGIGGYIGVDLQTAAATIRNASKIQVKWTDATDATRTSSLIFSGVTSAASQDWLTLSSGGAVQLNQYGTGSKTGTNAYSLYDDASGNVIESLNANTVVASSDFSVTSSVALVNVTGLTATVASGKTYRFIARLYTTSANTGGVQAAIAGTATATSVIYESFSSEAGSGVAVGTSRAAALGTKVADHTSTTACYITITGSIVVNTGGTLTVQFAQNNSDPTSSKVLIGSTFQVVQIQ